MFFLRSFINKLTGENVTPRLPSELSSEQSNSKALSTLTEQEYKVFMLIREGFSKKECSQRLTMKRGVVNKVVADIFHKLSVRTITELIIKYQNAS